MKTTIEVSDALFAAAKEQARQNNITMRSLIEEGLRRVLSDAKPSTKTAFKLKNAVVHGKSAPLSQPSDWQSLEESHVIQRVLKLKS